MPRPRKCRQIQDIPRSQFYKPQGVRMRDLELSILTHDQLEALRLADMDELDQVQAAQKMDISRSTFSRLVNEARHIVATALVQGGALKIEGGDFHVKGHERTNFKIKEKREEVNIMPGQDKTGPEGQGLTGRQLGGCADPKLQEGQGFEGFGRGQGQRHGRGQGCGRGLGRGRGRGQGGQ